MISTRGSSIVDYCVVPYENLKCFKNFEVIRASELANQSVTTGSIEPKYIPDHSVLCWENLLCKSIENEKSSKNQYGNKHDTYNVKNIPNNWMQDENVISLINSCIANIEYSSGSQNNVDDIYCEFINIIHNEMNSKLEKKVKIMNSCNNKRRRFKKPWWSNELTLKWNETCSAENQYLRSLGNRKC